MNMQASNKPSFKTLGYFLEYQPLVNFPEHRITGFEVLLRRRLQNAEVLSPDILLPQLLQQGELQALDLWVASTALAQQHAWRRGGHKVPLCLNITPQTLAEPAHISLIAGLIQHAAAPVTIEIIEPFPLPSFTHLHTAIATLHAADARVVLDDVGEGYASLRLVNELALDGIKIDRSFTQALETGKGRCLMRSLLALGRELPLSPVVEGVESAGHLQHLAELGAVSLQGWLFGRPQDAALTSAMLDAQGLGLWLDPALPILTEHTALPPAPSKAHHESRRGKLL